MIDPEQAKARAHDAVLAAHLFALAPGLLKGVSLRAWPSPARDMFLEIVTDTFQEEGPVKKCPANVSVEGLLGGLDLTATLTSGRPVRETGLLERSKTGILIMPMADAMAQQTGAIVAAALDEHGTNDAFGVIAFDEGLEPDEHPPARLKDRLSFHVDLHGISHRDMVEALAAIDHDGLELPAVMAIKIDDDALTAICGTATMLGVASFHAPLLAINMARVHAAFCGRDAIEQEDIVAACRLVLAPRATQLPALEDEATEETPPQDPPPPPPGGEDADQRENNAPQDDDPKPLEDQVVEATVAAIPVGLLEQLKALGRAKAKKTARGKSGLLTKGGGRGRPAGVFRGQARPGQRLNVLETLRAAAPWQRIRHRLDGASAKTWEQGRIRVTTDDFRVTRLKQRQKTVTIFVVDASGSSALNRLAEAKGAVEQLLAECYVRRDEVALIAFRGAQAELVLPPTRSLARAKKVLSHMPGGGGTPLASAIMLADQLTDSVLRKGQTPSLVFLSDGGANVALNGEGGRSLAQKEAVASAEQFAEREVRSVFVDTAPRPRPPSKEVAAALGAFYLPLPSANADAITKAASL